MPMTDDEITSAYYLYDAEDQNDFKTLSRAEQRLKTAIRLARWAFQKGKEDGLPIGTNLLTDAAIEEKIEQARADAHLEGQRHGEVMAHPKNCKANYDWAVRDAEASIRADERRKMKDKHMSQKRDWYDDGYAKGKEEGTLTERVRLNENYGHVVIPYIKKNAFDAGISTMLSKVKELFHKDKIQMRPSAMMELEALAAARKKKTRVSAETVHPSSCGKKSEED